MVQYDGKRYKDKLYTIWAAHSVEIKHATIQKWGKGMEKMKYHLLSEKNSYRKADMIPNKSVCKRENKQKH